MTRVDGPTAPPLWLNSYEEVRDALNRPDLRQSSYDGAKDWKAARDDLVELVGVEGVTVTPLRPAGTMLVGEDRIDVVADGEFLAKGATVRVVEVEGTRVVVEAVTADPASQGEAADPTEPAAVEPA